MSILRKILEPSWRLSKNKEVHQSISYAKGSSCSFIKSSGISSCKALPADIETAPTPFLPVIDERLDMPVRRKLSVYRGLGSLQPSDDGSSMFTCRTDSAAMPYLCVCPTFCPYSLCHARIVLS